MADQDDLAAEWGEALAEQGVAPKGSVPSAGAEGDDGDGALDRAPWVRSGGYLSSIRLPAVSSVFKAEEWDNFGLFTVDSSLIYSIIDVLLGGRRGQTAIRIEGRPYTTIETSLVKRM